MLETLIYTYVADSHFRLCEWDIPNTQASALLCNVVMQYLTLARLSLDLDDGFANGTKTQGCLISLPATRLSDAGRFQDPMSSP